MYILSPPPPLLSAPLLTSSPSLSHSLPSLAVLSKVWLHLQSIASLLHATFTSLSDSSPNGVAPRVLWGHMESYSWDVSAGRPAWHGYSWFKSHDCRQRTMRREEVLARSLAHANKTECRVAKDERGVARCGGGDEAVVAGPFGAIPLHRRGAKSLPCPTPLASCATQASPRAPSSSPRPL